MSAASQMWCRTPRLQPHKTFFPVCSVWHRPSDSSRGSRGGQNASPEQRIVLTLQTPSTAANTAEQQESSLTAASSSLAEIRGIIRPGDDEDVDVKRRLVLARLIKGVYELEYRRLVGISVEKDPPARSVWESAHFEAVEEARIMQQEPDKSIDLVVYKWNGSGSPSSPPCPRVVIAIRGTLPSMEDGWHNLHGSLQRLHLTPRYEQILSVVRNAVEAYGSDEVCITGHSLGAALGLLVARTLATEEGIQIESHLFNPVYAYTWIPTANQLTQNEGLWRTVRTVRCFTVAGLANILIDDESRLKIASEYSMLRDWTPHMYINTGDPICRGYWEYFTNHERLARNGALGAYFAYMAAPFSGRGLLTVLLGSKPSHLIPSVVLHVCEGEPPPMWPQTDLSDRSRYSGHNLGRWMTEDLPIHTLQVRLSNW